VREIPWKSPFHGILTLIFIYKAIWGVIDGISRTNLFENGPFPEKLALFTFVRKIP
jgi:hypothetical protein